MTLPYILIYIGITKEENSAFLTGNNILVTAPNQNPDSPDKNHDEGDDDNDQDNPTSPTEADGRESQPVLTPNKIISDSIPLQTIQINVDICDEERRKSISPCPTPGLHPHANFNLLSLPTDPKDQRSNSRRPSLLPVLDRLPDGYETPRDDGSTTELDVDQIAADGGGTSDEGDDEVPWIAHEKMPQLIKGFPPVSPYIGVR
jgi:hypothetical protein